MSLQLNTRDLDEEFLRIRKSRPIPRRHIHRWTVGEIGQLKKLYPTQISLKSIANLLDISISCLYDKAREIGLTREKWIWSSKDTQTATRMYLMGSGLVEIGKVVGRSYEQVDQQLFKVLGRGRARLRKTKPRPYQHDNPLWTVEETERLYACRAKGMTYHQISGLMGRTLASVKCKVELEHRNGKPIANPKDISATAFFFNQVEG